MRREDQDLERMATGMEVQGRSRSGRPKRRWLDSVRDHMKEKGPSGEEVYEVSQMEASIVIHRPPPHKSGTNRKGKKKTQTQLKYTPSMSYQTKTVLN